MPRYPYGRYLSTFVYDPKDHDEGQKTFLGETGNLNGEDIIRIIAKQPATARFIPRHLYNYFVADEPQVPAWQHTPPRDPEAIKMLEDEYFRSGTDIRSMLRVLFNSNFFKQSRFAKVKSPVETVIGTTRLVKDFDFPKPGFNALALNIRYMGQDILNPPTVEGWHTEGMDRQRHVSRAHQLHRRLPGQHQPTWRAGHHRSAACRRADVDPRASGGWLLGTAGWVPAGA
jgi:uncharacterized protein (DUF1800 family)